MHAAGVKNGRVLIIGSITPWVEACVLEAGARQIVTVEYSKIESYHTQIQTLTPNEFREHFLKGKLGLFDAVVTFSSVEHSGLGRYGDGLNPWGDMRNIKNRYFFCCFLVWIILQIHVFVGHLFPYTFVSSSLLNMDTVFDRIYDGRCRVLIIGSITPWVEACVLEAGARQIVTVEYSKIESYHTQIQTLTPNEFREQQHAITHLAVHLYQICHMDHKADFVVLVKDNLIPFVPTILVFVLAYPQSDRQNNNL
jgi:hypothetical protein